MWSTGPVAAMGTETGPVRNRTGGGSPDRSFVTPGGEPSTARTPRQPRSAGDEQFGLGGAT